ncbi:calcium-binding protein PBP1 [Citrus sinensis]|uniref:Calcium-binding protein PBP1 n=1 Tax=Citrus sinensis TaxID=2711 RepID=A0ACB8NY31_CITSI|nr:calcium-binding protein PBP1 [Citrus sinensis]
MVEAVLCPCVDINVEFVRTLTRQYLMAALLFHDDLADFEDYFPSMINRLGTEGFISELCNGFQLLMDGEKGLITFESLKRNSLLLGLNDMMDDEIMCMLNEGDLDGDGALSQFEFCILMVRLSPGLMEGSPEWMIEDLYM